MVWYDVVITIIIILGLILAIWAKISKQTIIELIRDITGFINEKKENAEENYLDI